MDVLVRCWRVTLDAFNRFNADDGWAIASHIALSSLMAMFPFLMVVTAMAGMIGSRYLGEEAADILLQAWPEPIAGPIALEIHSVLRSAHGGALTVGIVLALYFAASGVDSLRIGLNRAYSVTDPRSWWLLRIEAIGYVLVGAVALLAFAFLVVFAPLIWNALMRYFPLLEPFRWLITFARLTIAGVVLIMALVIVHLWLPAGRRGLRDIGPGIIATLLMWLVAGTLFGAYLADFAFTYSIYYAGLASPMMALVFLYLCASIFIYGGELNAAIEQARLRSEQTDHPC